MKPIGICRNEVMFSHSTCWDHEWVRQCGQRGIPFEIVDPYRYDIIREAGKYSALAWHYSNFSWPDLMEAQNILDAAAGKGVKVFPDNSTGWHFDDKIAEMYALQACGAAIPDSWVFYHHAACIEWLKNEAAYPLVAKLRRGSGSNNVKLLRNFQEAERYAGKMFTRGLQSAPSLIYKTFSKAQSTNNFKTLVARLKRVPEFLAVRRRARRLPREMGYCYFQQFIPNDGYDLKVVVVGDKLSFLARRIRKSDFRASGSGSIYYDKSLVTPEIRQSAFAAADALKAQVVGFDYVVNNQTGKAAIVEMCYGFDWEAQRDLGGYWDREDAFHDEPLNVPAEVLSNLLKNQ